MNHPMLYIYMFVVLFVVMFVANSRLRCLISAHIELLGDLVLHSREFCCRHLPEIDHLWVRQGFYSHWGQIALLAIAHCSLSEVHKSGIIWVPLVLTPLLRRAY